MSRKKYLFQRKGFYQTLDILKAHGSLMLLHEFFIELNKVSYYNAFYRVKPGMIDLGLIRITKGKNPSIANTIKGAQVRMLIKRLIAMEETF